MKSKLDPKRRSLATSTSVISKTKEDIDYMYEIVVRETNEHLGIFRTLEKAKDTVYDLFEGIQGDMVINRIPIDTISYFDPDTVWEAIRGG